MFKESFLNLELHFVAEKDFKNLETMLFVVPVEILECYSHTQYTVIPEIAFKSSVDCEEKLASDQGVTFLLSKEYALILTLLLLRLS